MKYSIIIIIVLSLLSGCSPDQLPQKTMSNNTDAIFIGKMAPLDEDHKKQLSIVSDSTKLIIVTRLFDEKPVLQGSKQQIEEQQRINDTTFATQDMFIAGDCLYSLKNTPDALLDHIYVKYYHTTNATVVCDVIIDPTNSTHVGEIK